MAHSRAIILAIYNRRSMTTNKLPRRVFCVGTQGCGTSTLAQRISEEYDLQLIRDSVRTTVGEMDLDIGAARNNLLHLSEFQMRIFLRQRRAELRMIMNKEDQSGEFVSDQAFDNVAYTMQFSPIGQEFLHSKVLEEYMSRLRENSIILYVYPYAPTIRDDGVRPKSDLDWGAVMRTDGIIFSLILYFKLLNNTHIIAAPDALLRMLQVRSILGPASNADTLEKALERARR